MNSKSSGIRKALPFLTLIFLLFSVLLIWSFFTLNHSNYFHQLNVRHFKYVSDLHSLISTPKPALFSQPPQATDTIRNAIINIRQQPLECLEKIGPIDRILMTFINTDNIISICQKDIVSANQALEAITHFEAGVIDEASLQEQLIETLRIFSHNSIEFEAPVEKTVNFIADIIISLIVSSCIILLLFTMYLSRAVSLVLTNREAAMKALAESEERNKSLAYKDTLTGLPNRNLLEHTINAAIAKSSRNETQFAVMFIDLDQFKDINDTLGHSVGDKLLIEMARRIAHTLRECDSVVRFGGDEFVAVTDCFDAVETIDVIASRVIDAINKPVKLVQIETFITASIGVACYPDNGTDATALLKHADTAMYQAKSAGKNQFQPYDKNSANRQNRKLSIVQQLHHAIANDEFSLVYQPVVRLADGKTVGSEALIRWTNMNNESIRPDEFIPIAENSGQIIEIGDWVLQQACAQCKRWHQQGATDHTMAINVSSHQLKDVGFAKRVATILQQYALPAKCIHIEITENIAITEDKVCVANLHELSELGALLLLDDFGTGYSCLSYLKDLPFDILKIDKSFMPANNTIAATIIAMGHELHMEIIAEGIETSMCHQYLNNLHCQYGQGYLFQKPVSASEFDVFKQFSVGL
ncbi:EAL domain-containing protein [Alteromonas sp. C1M14]|uniref:putative bifunctional diguanylate cyclase/phosphodiesterase n=1 Tax=Alteromonas sp. C1M14 TaxID=2841567 RepID=UPI001C095B7F|nr:EAL domain-containing protein [Alteromonas sp. C1M14]MBU2979311.1 EAL domain-containing protein [Alteromonas sp. C1M14]